MFVLNNQLKLTTMKKKYLILLLFFVGIITTYSQNITVKGKISDSNGISLPGVNIVVKGTKNSTSTGMDGDYTIIAPNGAVLEFSFIGFESKEIKVTGSSLNIVLNESSQNLDEVVVVGFSSQKKANLTGAVAKVNVERVLGSRPVTDISKSLQGTTPD